MSANLLVQIKREHHQPGEDDPAQVFELVSKTNEWGVINDLGSTGQTRTLALSELRYAGSRHEQESLDRAVRAGHNRVVARLLQENPLLDPNGNREMSLLDLAGQLASGPADRMVQTLLDHGADIHHQAFGNDHGPHWTPLWVAVHDNNLAHAKRLLAHGANFELTLAHTLQSLHYTVLHLAASCGASEMMMWLMDQSGCPTIPASDLRHEFQCRKDRVNPDTYEATWQGGVVVPLLHLSASMGLNDKQLARKFIEWLIESGEEWEAVDHNGETAWQVARRLNSPMCVVFDEKLAQSHAVRLDVDTAPAKGTRPRPRV